MSSLAPSSRALPLDVSASRPTPQSLDGGEDEDEDSTSASLSHHSAHTAANGRRRLHDDDGEEDEDNECGLQAEEEEEEFEDEDDGRGGAVAGGRRGGPKGREEDGERELTVDDVLSGTGEGGGGPSSQLSLAFKGPPGHRRPQSLIDSLGGFAAAGRGKALEAASTERGTGAGAGAAVWPSTSPLGRLEGGRGLQGLSLFLDGPAADSTSAGPSHSPLASSPRKSRASGQPSVVLASLASSPSRRSFGASLGLDIAAAISGGPQGDGAKGGGRSVVRRSEGAARARSSSPPSATSSASSSPSSSSSTSPSSPSDGLAVAERAEYRSAAMSRRSRLSATKGPPQGRTEEAKEAEANNSSERPPSAAVVQSAAEEEEEDSRGRGAAASVSLSRASLQSSPGDSPRGAPNFHFSDADDDSQSQQRAAASSLPQSPAEEEKKADTAASAASPNPFAATEDEDAEDEDDNAERAKAEAARREAEKEEALYVQRERDRETQLKREEEEAEAKRVREKEADEQRQKVEEAERLRQRRAKEEAEEEARKRKAEEAAAALVQKQEAEKAAAKAAAEAAATAAATAAAAEFRRSSSLTAATATDRPTPSAAVQSDGAAVSALSTSVSTPSASSPSSSASSAPAEADSVSNVSEWRSRVKADITWLVDSLLVQPPHVHPFPHSSPQQRPPRVAYLLIRCLQHFDALAAPSVQAAPSAVSTSAPSLLTPSGLSFRSAFSSSSSFSSSLATQLSLRFLPSAARAKSVDSSSSFPHPLPFSSLSAAPHYSLPQAAEADDDDLKERSIATLTPQDRSFALSVLLRCLHSAVHSALASLDQAALCSLFAVVAHLRRFVQPSTAATTSASPVLDRAYAIAFIPSAPLLPSSPSSLSSFLYPPSSDLSIVQWFALHLLDVHAAVHASLVQSLLLQWQSSAPPIQKVWQEDEGLTSVVLESYSALYAELDGQCKAAGWTLPHRQSLLAVCLRSLVTATFNSLVAHVHNYTMDTGLRVKLLCSNLTEFGLRLCGDTFMRTLQTLVTPLQESAMVLLMDKSSCELSELTQLTPHLSLLTIHHLVFVYLQSEGNEEDSVSPHLLQQLAQAAVTKEQKEGQATDGQQSASLPTQTVLLIDLSPPQDAAAVGQQGVAAVDRERLQEAWQAPEAVEHNERFHYVTAKRSAAAQ